MAATGFALLQVCKLFGYLEIKSKRTLEGHLKGPCWLKYFYYLATRNHALVGMPAMDDTPEKELKSESSGPLHSPALCLWLGPLMGHTIPCQQCPTGTPVDKVEGKSMKYRIFPSTNSGELEVTL